VLLGLRSELKPVTGGHDGAFLVDCDVALGLHSLEGHVPVSGQLNAVVVQRCALLVEAELLCEIVRGQRLGQACLFVVSSRNACLDAHLHLAAARDVYPVHPRVSLILLGIFAEILPIRQGVSVVPIVDSNFGVSDDEAASVLVVDLDSLPTGVSGRYEGQQQKKASECNTTKAHFVRVKLCLRKQ